MKKKSNIYLELNSEVCRILYLQKKKNICPFIIDGTTIIEVVSQYYREYDRYTNLTLCETSSMKPVVFYIRHNNIHFEDNLFEKDTIPSQNHYIPGLFIIILI